ncbi:hypothetical protein Halru_0227 [Halovivax ruber XH-70]|uniref:Uncharacterized protein n=1 Tax=Halovivax ruber (strain DSM 18193 / JCM 13892 / XH-70) TaxID=797302 RepID=L0I7W4_HALRX|nr:hypothetical protein [Halovivax ruber]AGB14873.1 hypothetical protein Halru_0227 [Halovivax ruber XH-70]
MKSVERTSDGTGDAPRSQGCYRCDRDVAPSRLFRVDIELPEPLDAQYRHAVRYCGPDCAAAMNLSEFSDRVKARARGGGKSVGSD